MDSRPPSHTLPPGLSIIHSNHLEDLRRVVVNWVRRHPLKPLENEVFIVQSNGMAQWLKLALAQDDGCGISAALEFQLPARFVWQAYRAVLGPCAIPDQSPFDKPRLTWRLLRLLPSLATDERFETLIRFLDHDPDQRKHFQLAGRLADLFDQYQVYRADWLADWARGIDRLRLADGKSSPMPAEHAWQADLWRCIRADVPLERRDTSRSSVHRSFLEKARTLERRPADLPRRVIVFGICSLPLQTLEALQALSAHSQVLLFVLNPCRYYWADIIEDRELLRIERARHRPKAHMPDDLNPDQLHQHVNPLLAAWGKQGRDYIGLLYGYDRPDAYRPRFAQIDMFEDFVPVGGTGSLLQQVQQAILDLKPLPAPGEERQPVAPGDRSIGFQLAHSRQREVEILQDQLLAAFETMPGLQPRDIMIMAPDITLYGPHIEAVFGNVDPQDPRHIPFSIADRPEGDALALLLALEKLMYLPQSRLTAGDIMDLLEVPAVRERFGLGVADLQRLTQWIEGAGIRWGLNAEQRQGVDLPAGLEQNTWRFGLQRMLLGYAVGSGDAWQGIEPYNEVGGLEAALVGPLATLVQRLDHYWPTLDRPAPPEAWGRRIRNLVQDFFHPADSREGLILARLETVLETWLEACRDAEFTDNLTLPVVRETLLPAMHDLNHSQRFLAGMVNFGTLMPMRSIPFRVVCLLGMNDGEYPRSRPPLDFDLMAAHGLYRPGDRSRREDDRYLFLEALLAAREKLIISYIGRSTRDNSRHMPSVLVGQLRDVLATGWKTGKEQGAWETGGQTLLDGLTCQHPLQPFSPRYFQHPPAPDLFTYAREWRQVLDPSAAGEDRVSLEAPVFEGNLQLIELIGILKDPVEFFFTRRLKVFFDDPQEIIPEQESFALDTLAPFGPGARLLAAGLAAEPSHSLQAIHRAAERLRRTGELPFSGLGELSAEQLAQPVRRMLERHHGLSRQWPQTTEAVEIRLPVELSGCGCELLEDWLDGLHRADAGRNPTDPSAGLARWEFYPLAILDPGGRLTRMSSLVALWVRHLAACAQGLDLTSHLVAPDALVVLPALAPDSARRWLVDLTAHWWQGLTQPLPVTAKTALAYLKVSLVPETRSSLAERQAKAYAAARRVYEGDGFNSAGELGYNRYLARTYPDFETLWQADGNRFQTLVRRLYEPLAAAVAQGALR